MGFKVVALRPCNRGQGSPAIGKKAVKAMLGGKWPKGEKTDCFGFDEVDHYEICGDELVPMDEFGVEVPGPNFKLVVS
jgi:hypothetical protein